MADRRAARASTSSGAPLVWMTGCRRCASMVDHQLSRGSKRNSCAPVSRRGRRHVDPGLSAATRAGQLGGVAAGRPAAPAGRRCCTRPRPRRAAQAGPGASPTCQRLAGSDDRAARWRASPVGGPDVVTCIRFSVRVPVLSVQITVVEPRVSTADSRLTSAPRRASSPDADGQRERDGGQQPFGHVGDQRARWRSCAAAATDSPAASPSGRNASPAPTATSRDQPGRPLDLLLQRALVGPARWLSAAIRPSSVRIPVDVTSATGFAAGAGGAAEDHVAGLEQGTVGSAVGRAGHRRGLAGQGGQVHLQGAGDQPGVGADPGRPPR